MGSVYIHLNTQSGSTAMARAPIDGDVKQHAENYVAQTDRYQDVRDFFSDVAESRLKKTKYGKENMD